MIIVSRATQSPTYDGPGDGRSVVLIDARSGALNFSIGHMTFPIGGKSDVHTRASEECIYIIKGRSAVTAGAQRYDLEAGDCIFIPPGIEHFHENTGDTELEQVWVFAPQGPEDGLKKLPSASKSAT